MSEPLLPCPFCGSVSELRVYDPFPEQGYEKCGSVCCGNCGADVNFECGSGGTPWLVKQWNRRAAAWISVEERLPEKGQEVLLLVNAAPRVRLGTFRPGSSLGDWYHRVEADGYETDLLDDPTHWMPLPEAPRTEGGRISPAAAGMEKIDELEVSVPVWPLPEPPK